PSAPSTTRPKVSALRLPALSKPKFTGRPSQKRSLSQTNIMSVSVQKKPKNALTGAPPINKPENRPTFSKNQLHPNKQARPVKPTLNW
ncbi:hypothetical protein J6590_107783, partial [Homalodisca vitripennis]